MALCAERILGSGERTDNMSWHQVFDCREYRVGFGMVPPLAEKNPVHVTMGDSRADDST